MKIRSFDTQAHKKMVLETYARTDRPILAGPTSMLRGWQGTLAETEDLLEDMVRDGKLRRVTDAEKRQYDVQTGYFPLPVV
jgi:hypothetical protein